jgi:RNA recognition motif-containing protein
MAKVFVGNLAFRVTDQDLQNLFQSNGCQDVKSGVIITRGRRSLGFGFVEFDKVESASAAVQKMNDKDLYGRQIKVELAKERSEMTQGEAQPGEKQQRSSNTQSNASGLANSGNNDGDSPTHGGRSGRGRGRGRGRGGRGGRSSSGGRFGGNRRRNNNRNEDSQDQGAPQERQPKEPKEPKAPRPPRPARENIPSKTTLFVSNLPFTFRDADLAKTFDGTKFKEAHVALTRNGRSRGYGFVEFENEQDQQAALKAKNGLEVSYVTANDKTPKVRNITVTIANSVEKDQATEGQKTDAQ